MFRLRENHILYIVYCIIVYTVHFTIYMLQNLKKMKNYCKIYVTILEPTQFSADMQVFFKWEKK